MNEQKKILFAEVYQNIAGIKGLLKEISKSVEHFAFTDENWDNAYKRTQGMVGDIELITSCCREMLRSVDAFVANGPYYGATATRTPLESMADE